MNINLYRKNSINFFTEQTVQEKAESKNQEDNELKKRLKEKEREKSAKEELWKEEKRRRESADKAWDVSNDISRGELSKDDKKCQNANSDVSLSKLEETILKVQQQFYYFSSSFCVFEISCNV